MGAGDFCTPVLLGLSTTITFLHTVTDTFLKVKSNVLPTHTGILPFINKSNPSCHKQ
jgi:hypothetical protein